uniref:Integrase catalytic domain-containing protein n=1 Tax=Strigamia maritima TaxID=126957 RepID=T1IZ50_STRMM
MDRDTRIYVKACRYCQQYKPNQHKKCAGPYTPHNMTTPWEVMCIDLMGPKPASRSQFKWILVIIDQCTIFIEFFPLTKATSTKIVDKVNEVACRFRHPDKIISDNGPQFIIGYTSSFVQKGTSLLSIPVLIINRPIKQNRDIKMMLAIYTDVHSQWPRFLNEFAYVQHTSKSEATGYTPLFLNTGRTVPLPFDLRIIKHDGNRLDPNNPSVCI